MNTVTAMQLADKRISWEILNHEFKEECSHIYYCSSLYGLSYHKLPKNVQHRLIAAFIKDYFTDKQELLRQVIELDDELIVMNSVLLYFEGHLSSTEYIGKSIAQAIKYYYEGTIIKAFNDYMKHFDGINSVKNSNNLQSRMAKYNENVVREIFKI